METKNTIPQVHTPLLPKVSIGMPVYNGEPFIREALNSLLAQTYADFELIISDNGSTDSTQVICKEFAAKDARIRYVRQAENRGPVANFQFVLDESVGEYFMWCAVDDKRDQTFLEQGIEILDNNPDCVSVLSHYEIFDINNSNILEKITPSSIGSNSPFLRIKRSLEDSIASFIYGLHRKSVIVDIPLDPFDLSDILFVSRLVSKGKYFIIPKVLYWVGINGSKRKPYSMTGRKVDFNLFRKKVFILLLKHSKITNFSLYYNFIKITIKLYFSQIRINKEIKNN